MASKELLKTINSVSIDKLSLSKKEAKTLTQCITAEETPLLLCHGAEVKVVLTTENFFIITSRMIRAAKVKAIPLNSIKNVQEKRGILLAKVTLTTAENHTAKLANLDKKASGKIMGFLKSRENITTLPIKRPGILDIIYKIAVTTLFVFIRKDMLSGTIVAPSNGKAVIDLNTGQVIKKKSTTAKQWFEGGTLHNATLKQWRKATPANKLATCADFVATAWKEDKLKPHIENTNELKYYAQELVTFIDTGADGIKGIEHYKVTIQLRDLISINKEQIAGTKTLAAKIQRDNAEFHALMIKEFSGFTKSRKKDSRFSP